ncbi:hypothetical protein ASPCADRAFT_502646 [Aspergillus carbonarius ITEM 5010]|uniref:Arrestin-like N-terminal domain-containing protein n=1 Tax=Aspergillus carbonarius (strain ITEM 5010) TaxID=602072 RepID=A0A1R3S0K4_ASPC5|nr:hypothetical protein ASPCADRAFT_502646 [Aspergillus carbonarius ITEM 5010]
MAPKVHIEINQLLARNAESANTTATSSDKTNPIITDGYLDGDVIISINNLKDTIDPSAEYLVEVTFEGKLSTSIHLNISTQLLRMAKNLILLRASDIRELSPNQPDASCPSTQTFIHPFHFTIPQTADPTSSSETGLPLPPSLSFKPMSVYDSNDLTLRGQCRIDYCLKARLFDQSGCIAEDEFPVTFAPTHECPPPICITDFPREYTLHSSQHIRDLLSRRDLYHLSIQTEEPAPLHLHCLNTAFTIIPLKWTYQCLASSKHHHPPDLFAKIQTSLRATTFLSVTSQPRVPTQGEANKLKNFRLLGNTSRVGPTQVRKLRIASWEIQQDVSDSGKTPPSPISPSVNPDLLTKDTEYDAESTTAHNQTTWESTAHLIFTFDHPEYIPPTFTHPYVSRRYSLSIVINVDGSRDGNFGLQVPVHVSYDRRGQDSDLSVCEDVRVHLDTDPDPDLWLESGSTIPPPYMA